MLPFPSEGESNKVNYSHHIEHTLLPTLLGCSSIAIFFLIITIISKEKRQKTMGLLRRIGLVESSYALSLLFIASSISFLSAIATVAVLKIFAGESLIIIVSTDFGVLLVLQFIFNLCMSSYAYMIGSIISRPIFVHSFLGLLIFAVVALNAYYTYPQIFGRSYFNLATNYFESWKALLLLFFCPWVEYSKIWCDIATVTTINDLREDYGVFTFDNLAVPTFNETFLLESQTIPTPLLSLVHLIIVTLIYYLLGWYFQQAIPSIEGLYLPWNFPLTLNYWFPRDKVEPVSSNDEISIAKNMSKDCGGIHALKLSKTYKGKSAVKEFSKVMESGKLYCLLGHNGA